MGCRSRACEKSIYSRCFKRLFSSSLFRSWWAFLLMTLLFCFYTHAMQKKEEECSLLKKRLDYLHQEKKRALEQREDLLLCINSQSDPEWIQMILMKKLGLVPEGQQKVYFKEE